jgi:hypothetical protein
MVDPTVLDVQRAVFAATRGVSRVLLDDRLYRDPWLVHDITHYRAAAIAVKFVEEMVKARIAKNFDDFIEYLDAVEKERIDSIEHLQNWRGLFSPTGEEYHSLNRTLMNLPGGVPASMVADMARVELPRPITSRIELDFVLAFTHTRRQDSNFPIAIHATKDQIIEGIKRVNRYTHNEFSTRRAHDILLYARFLNDYPERHTGNLVGLTDRAIWWHRTQRERDIDENVTRLGADTPAAKPPIALPVLPEIRFLDTVKAICEEGLTMEHCVASYSEGAVHGSYYLFHVDHAGEAATIEVNRQGKVLQAYGPKDKLNQAVDWGKRALNRWGKNFPESANYPEEVHLDPWLLNPLAEVVLPPPDDFLPDWDVPF